MMRYGVVGVGYFGADLARFMNEFDDAQITMVYDPENGETIAQELQCVAAKSLEELVTSPDVDCVIVATPNYLHKEPVILAAKNKKHVFCEKPIALSYQDCDDMVRACEENGVTFMAGHVMNFFNGVHHAKELINQGVIGKVLYCHTARNGWEEQQPTISWKKIREKSGGHLYHHIHELDCVQFIMGGMPKTVTMAAANVAHKGENFGGLVFHETTAGLVDGHLGENEVLVQSGDGGLGDDTINLLLVEVLEFVESLLGAGNQRVNLGLSCGLLLFWGRLGSFDLLLCFCHLGSSSIFLGYMAKFWAIASSPQLHQRDTASVTENDR